MTTVTLRDGSVVWYRRLGQGPAILQIHGSAFGHRNFEKLTPEMQHGCEVIDFDLPGFGDSRPGKTPFRSMEDLAALVAEVIRALGLERVHVHGTSYGAMIGLALAARHPEVVDHLVLSCFIARWDRAAAMMRATWKRAAKDSGMSAVADLTAVVGFARSYFERPEAQAQLESMREAFSRTAPAAFIASVEAAERADLTPFARQIQAPTLILAGENDAMTPLHAAASGVGLAEAAKLIPGCKEVHVVKDSGHYLVIEQPAAVARKIRAFLGVADPGNRA